MALADRRPLDFPVTSPTTASPSFQPKNLDSTGTIYNGIIGDDELLINEELGNLDVNDSIINNGKKGVKGKKNYKSRKSSQDINIDDSDNIEIDQDQDDQDDQDEGQEQDDDESINSTPLSPIDDLTPTSRSISPDSLMNSDQKFISGSSRSSTPNGSGSGSGSIYKNQNQSNSLSNNLNLGNVNQLNGNGIGNNQINSINGPVNSGSSNSANSANGNANSNGGNGSGAGGSVKKPKNTSRVPIATGISTTIPVTGEKPKPSQKDDPSLEDDVLFAIFLILFEKDSEGKGMTVKQICDILIDRHPEMANLSTKTSNLVSAKLNAYVKRVEKGDSSLKYALSRDWADASPKRMVYVYRGLLTEDFHIHVKNMMENQKLQEKKNNQFSNNLSSLNLGNQNGNSNSNSNSNGNGLNSNGLNLSKNNNNLNGNNNNNFDDDSFEAGKQASLKPRRQTMFDLGINRNSFLSSSIEKSNLFVPYNSAPVTASLKDKFLKKDSESDKKSNDQINQGNGDNGNDNGNNDDEDGGNHNDDGDHEDGDHDDDHDVVDGVKKSIFEDFEVFNDNANDYIETLKKNGKRSKSMSFLNNKKHKILTAAAAAPRAPKTPCSHSPNAAAAAAALHAAAIKSINCEFYHDVVKSNNHHNMKWLNVIRSGFLSQDIGNPEDISLSDLDKYF